MVSEKLDESNFFIFAAHHYQNPCFDTVEFYDDLQKLKYIKRLFNRYEETGDLKERLILNHIVVLYNVFGVEAATRMLFFKLEGYYHYLKPFLVLLNYMPEVIFNIGLQGKDIRSTDISMDPKIVDLLRKI